MADNAGGAAGPGGLTQQQVTRIYEMQQGFETMAASVGIVERNMAKMKGAILGQPIVKFGAQIKAMGGQMLRTNKGISEWRNLTKEQKKEMKGNMTIIQKLVIPMMAYTKIGGQMNKIVQASNTGLGRLTARFFGLFSILFLMVFAFTAISLAIDGANSPIAKMAEDTPVLSNAINGLILVLHGEDGQGGLKGAMDIVIASVFVFAAVWIVFGTTVAAITAGAFLVIGTFKLVKKATGDTKIALLAAAATFTLVVGALIAFFTSAGIMAVAAVTLPIALILGAGAIFWAVITGKAPKWLAWVGIFMLSLAAIIIGFTIAAPILIVAAAIGLAVSLIALIIVHREKIYNKIKAFVAWAKTFWKENKSKIITVGKWLVAFPIMLGLLIGKKIKEFLVKNKTQIRTGFMGIIAMVLDRAKSFGTKIAKGIAWVTGIPGRMKDALLAKAVELYNALAGVLSFTIPALTIAGYEVFGDTPVNLLPQIPALAEGGIVTGPTLALIGEAGPEAVIPLSKGGGNGMGSTFNISINVGGVTDRTDKRELAMQISNEIQKEMRRWGRGTTMRSV